jgi:hypothetical protein
MQKRMLKIFVSLFLIISFIGLSSALTCSIISEKTCTDNGWHVVMKLSSLTNAHAELATQAGYIDNVLCCDEARSTTTCSTINAIVRLSATGNAHLEIPTQSNYPNFVCYQDVKCLSLDTTGSDCSTSTSGQYPIGMLSLSSPTNAHAGSITTYPLVSVCCEDLRAGLSCLLSASWKKTDAKNGEPIGMNVVGACGGQTITFEVYEQITGLLGLVTGEKVIPPTIIGTYSSSGPSGSWDAVWDAEGSNKYFFKAFVGTSQVKSTNILSVLEQSIEEWCTNKRISQCSNYDEALCSDNPCKISSGCPNSQGTCGCAWSPLSNTCVPAVTPVTSSYCGDGNVDLPNSVGTNEQCDPDAGTSVFLDAENTCNKVNPILTDGVGILECQTNCIFDTNGCVNPSPPRCGDNIINNVGEYCDGTNLGVYSNCETLGYDGGTLSCYASGNSNECEYDLSQCTHTNPALDFCGDLKIDTPNSGNMNEECDGTFTSTCSDFGSYTGGSATCSTGCLIDISQCTGGTSTCGDDVINQLTEECDTNDLHGLTCGYLGFAVDNGGLSCFDDTCTLDTQDCVVDTSRTIGSCLIHIDETRPDTNGCEDGILEYYWRGEWTENEANRPEDCPMGDVNGNGVFTDAEDDVKHEVAPCIAQAQLPFFGIYQFAISFALILGIYFLVAKMKKKK